MASSVTCEGDERAAARLERVGDRAAHQRETMLVAARQTQRALTGIPVDTGRLERGTKGGSESTLDVDDSGFELGTNVPYGRFVYRGTRYMSARPPRIPDVGPKVARAIATDLSHA